MKTFEALFKNKTGNVTVMVIKKPTIKSRLDAYNHICANKYGVNLGELLEIREKNTNWGNSLNN
ncbi:MAG: hypothetical protein J6J71_01300 [Prevotella sp.]|nr:hypothetical protein [Prevotella sp.]